MKRGQMKIQQMAFMLMAVTLFFVLVGMFFLVVLFYNLSKSAEDLSEKNALLLVSKLANSPEFSCGEAFGGVRINCVDGDKVMMLKDSMDIYKDFWGVSNIEVYRVYPDSGGVVCNQGNYPDCDVIRIVSGDVKGIGVSNFVSLCRKSSFEGNVYDECDLAKLVVSYGE